MSPGSSDQASANRASPDELKTLIKGAIDQLASANRHHEFEHLCVGVAKRCLIANLRLSTGPVSAGGDRGQDGASYWTCFREADPTAGRFARSTDGKVIVACTTGSSDLRRKIRKDFTSVLGHGPGIDTILYFTASSLEAATLLSIRDEIAGACPTSEIYDREFLADKLSEPSHFHLAVAHLHLPARLLPLGLDLDELHAKTTLGAETAMGRFGSVPNELSLSAPLDIALGRLDNRDGLDQDLEDCSDWLKSTESHVAMAEISVERTAAALPFHVGKIRKRWSSAHQRFDKAGNSLLVELLGDVSFSRSVLAARTATPLLQEVASVLADLAAAAYDDFRVRRLSPHSSRPHGELARCCYSAQSAFSNLIARLLAESSGALVVLGGWGTGKSYHCGRYALDRVRANLPTIFVVGRDLTERGIPWLEAIASRIDNQSSGRELLHGLQLHAMALSHRAVVILDGANEAAANDHGHELAAMVDTISRYPEISLVVTSRSESRGGLDIPDGRWARYEHRGVEPSASWELLRRHFELPPVAVPWSIPDYSRPLILRMFVRCCQLRSPAEAVGPPAVGELLDDWLAVLGDEYARRSRLPGDKCSHRHGVLGSILREVDHTYPGQPSRTAIRAALRGQDLGTEVDRGIDYLIDEGVLAERLSGIGYALERIGEYRHARQLLESGTVPATRTVAAGEGDPDQPDHITAALAELAPSVLQRELLPKRGRGWKDGLPRAFAFSLQHRAAKHVHQDTIERARDLIDARGLDYYVWFAAMVNSPVAGHGVGASFVHAELRARSARERDQCWVVPMYDLLDQRDGTDRAAMAKVVVWIDREADAGRLSKSHARELAFMMMWWLALPAGRAEVAATRTLATLIRRYPGLATALLKEAAAIDDLDILAGVWTAVYGAVVREGPTDIGVNIVDGARCAFDWGGATITLPAHYRVGVAAYRLLCWGREHGAAGPGPPNTLREFMAMATVPRPGGMPGAALPIVVGKGLGVGEIEHDIPWFVDPAGFRWADHKRRAGQLMVGLGGLRLARSMAARPRGQGEEALMRKYSRQVHESWLGEQVRRFPAADSVRWRGAEVEEPDPTEASEVHPDKVYFAPCVDASAGLSQQFHSDLCEPGCWWVVPAVARLFKDARPAIVDGKDVVGHDRFGQQWWLLDGVFRIMLPCPPREFPYEQVLQAFNGDVRHRPMALSPGRRRHLFVTIRSATVPTGWSSGMDDLGDADGGMPAPGSAPPMSALGAELRRECGEVSPLGPRWTASEYSADGKTSWGDPFRGCRIPSGALRSQLGLQWTGSGLDFVDGDGVRMITDPSLAQNGPSAIVLADGGLQALARKSLELVWRMEVRDVSTPARRSAVPVVWWHSESSSRPIGRG